MIDLNPLGPNAGLIGAAGSRQRLATPALLLDLDGLEANIAAMARLSRERGLALRPHAKTHKSLAVARRQIEAGALGVCVANLREAAVMIAGGITGVHLTSPVVVAVKLDILAALSPTPGVISAVVDNPDNLQALEAAVRRAGRRLSVLIDLDLGAMYRTGVAEPAQALALAQALAASDVLDYAGVQFYSGIVQHIPTADQRTALYAQELDRLRGVIDLLTARGLKPGIVSGGGTGTFDLDARSGLFTENQAGSYVVMDMEYAAVELGAHAPHPFRPALFVQGSVISNNVRGLVTIDVGSKAYATDGPSPRIVAGAPEGALYQAFGDEFGVVLFEEIAARMAGGPPTDVEYGASAHAMFHDIFGSATAPPGRMPIGAKVELMAPHCDPTVNLHAVFHCVRGDTLVDIWPVDARGSL